jgi:hypothetical protein
MKVFGMPNGAARLFGLGLCLLGCAWDGRAAAQTPGSTFAPGAERPEDLPEGPGREETFYACTACHNFKLVAAQGMTRRQWDESLAWMTSRHNMADIQGADRALILDYLEKHYPPRARSGPGGGWKNPFAPQ